MKEKNVQNLVGLAVSQAGGRVFRINVGMGWQGQATKLANGDMLIKNARPFVSVVGANGDAYKGFSDFIGIVPVKITPDMVGMKLGVFAAIENKKSEGGRVSPEQKQFLELIRSLGGFAGVARSPEDALSIIKIQGESGEKGQDSE
jgi:hypothetical protein